MKNQSAILLDQDMTRYHIELGLCAATVLLLGGLAACGPRRPAPRPLPLVRACGALVGDHMAVASYAWVQPCERRDTDGCDEACRPAADRCEAVQAQYRAEPHRQSQSYWDRLEAELRRACR